MSKKSFYKTNLTGTSITFLLLIVLASNPSCYSIKPGATQSGGKLYESFYLGEEGRQYFIKPLKFSGADGGHLMIDFTFRRGGGSSPPAIANFTLSNPRADHRIEYSPEYHPLDSIGLGSDGAVYLLSDLNLISHATTRKDVVYRSSSRLAYQKLRSFITSDNNKIIVYDNGKAYPYFPNRRTSKALTKLNVSLFSPPH